MEILYEFNTVGIVFTAIIGGLCLLLLIPTFVFAAKRIQPGAATVLFRVLDILLIVVLLVAWCAYVLMHIKIFGFSIADNGGNLSLSGADGEIFALPNAGWIVGICNTVLSAVLLGVLSVIALLSLILSFACRRQSYGVTIRLLDADSEEYAQLLNSENVTELKPLEPDEEMPATTEMTAIHTPTTDEVTDEPATPEESDQDASVKPATEQPEIPTAEQDTMPQEEDVDLAFTLDEPIIDGEPIMEAELIEDEDEFVPVEIIDEPMPIPEPPLEPTPASVASDEPEELTDEVKDAIKVAALDMPQTVKDALRIVVESNNAFVVKEVLRVLVESDSVGVPAANDEPLNDYPTYEPQSEEVPQAEEPTEEQIADEPIVEQPTDELFDQSMTGEPLTEEIIPEVAATQEPVYDVAEPTPEQYAGGMADESVTPHIGLLNLASQAPRKTYKSSLRKPEDKKKS